MPDIYMRKPVEARAVQFTDNASAEDIQTWINDELSFAVRFSYADDTVVLIQVFTFNGIKSLYKDDWFVIENGEESAMTNEQFQLTYSKKDII